MNKGFFSTNDKIAPAYINTSNPKYIEIDSVYYSTLLIINYNREYDDLIFKDIIDTNFNANMSIFYEKQDAYKIIKDLTYHIGNVGVDLKSYNEGRQDIDIAAFTYNDAKYIRREMQLNGQDLYYIYALITVFSQDKKDLEYNLNKIEGVLQSKGLQTRRAYFRQEHAFRMTLPFFEKFSDIENVLKRNVLTNGLLSTYPFITSTIFDEDGIYFGTNINNNSLVFVNKYNNNKYKNSNMIILGTSGAGKSFFMKLLILRYRLLGIEQYIIDPEREYGNLCKVLDGVIVKIGPSSNTFINIFDIREESLEDNQTGFLITKISKLMNFFSLIFKDLSEKEKALLEEKIIIVYNKKNINFNDDSLYFKNNSGKINIKGIFKSPKDMPIMEDLYKELLSDNNTKSLAIQLMPFIFGSLKFFNHITNIDISNKLIVADIYELGEDNLKYGMFVFIELFWDKIKKNRKIKKSIYLDEIWRLIGVTSNNDVASFVYKIFKTIRKYGGSAIAITQDVSDLFSLDNGVFGKSILNNSSIKVFFSLEEENIRVLEQFENISEREKIEIKSLKRGEALMIIGNDHIVVKIESSEDEKKIISGDVID